MDSLNIMRLLQMTGTLNPAYGGPPVVVNQITNTLKDLGHTVNVVTLDSPEATWARDAPGRVYAFGPAVGKFGYSRGLARWLQLHASDYDAVIVHGIWQYQSIVVRYACRPAGVPYFVFVHGALDPWFAMHYPVKHVKKSLYWRLVEHRVLSDARSVFFTREDERQLARSSFSPYRLTEAVVDIGISQPDGVAQMQRMAFLSAFPGLHNKRLVLFLSRIHAKKGCDLLIRAFATVCKRQPDLRLVMAGPDEAGTRADMEALSETVGIADRVIWTGMLSGDVKWGAYHAADVFALTSHSENFGIVIPEALACSLPVLITNKVNIWREVDEAGAGFVESDTLEGAIALLRSWLVLTETERNEMRIRAHKCFVDHFDARRAASNFADLLSTAIGAEKP